MVRFLLLFVLLYSAGVSDAQTPLLSNWRSQNLTLTSSPTSLDSLTILPSSLRIVDQQSGIVIDTSLYRLEGKQLHWDAKLLQASPPRQFKIQYKVLPYDLGARFSHLDTTQIRVDDDGSYIGFDYSPYDAQEGMIEFKGLDYNGSFARGISVGNNQNLVLNSTFNLQLAGDLGDDIEILAAITDQNIPLQPEGNTQQLQEFDKIFIQLKKKKHVFIAGDYELARPESYFMNYYKKLQGATYQNEDLLLSEGKQLSIKASGAVARGKFARNTLNQLEGNQGPYRLEGREGESFIIILAGTEKVYIDGELLKRGIEEDYIIDYNRAEVTFTPKRLITKDRRIIVEFEYNTQNYLRSLFAAGTEYKTEKARVYLQLYSEQDGRNSGAAQELDSLDRIELGLAGDDLDNTFGRGIDSLEEFSEFRVKYRFVDTTYTIIGQGTIRDTVLVFSTNAEGALYTANFIQTAFGLGDYVLDSQNGANGRVYRWVAPDSTGQRQGNFFPGQRLIAPSQQQMFTAGVEYQLTKNSSIHTEVALSNTDLNRFSGRDDGDNAGLALYSHYQHKQALGKQKNSWQLQTDLNYEHVQRNFRSLNPYRSAEFNRDWNLRNIVAGSTNANEHLAKGEVMLSKDSLGSLSYSYSGFFRGGAYDGNKHSGRLLVERGGFRADLQASLLLSQDSLLDGQFFRPRIDLSKQFSRFDNWTVGLYGERERNEQRLLSGDTLSPLSFYYDMVKVYLNSPQDDRPVGIQVNYLQRYDYAPLLAGFAQSTRAEELGVSGHWNVGQPSRLKWNFTYRQLEINNPTLTNEQPQQTFLGRLEHGLSLFKGAVRSNISYQIGSGQEPRIEYEYLRVNPGEGIYTWLEDRNGDGQVQIDEIEIAAFQDQADVVRVTLFTNDFIRTNNVQLNQSLRIDTRKLWRQKKDIRKFLSRFSTQSTLQILRKTMESDEISPWNPFQLNVSDTSLVSVSSSIRNTLFFNRSNPTYDLQAGQFDNRSRNVLTTGFESRRSNEQFFRSRWNISKSFSTQFYIATGRQFNDSEFFNTRDYDIRLLKIQPKLTFQVKQNFRTIFSYKFLDSENIQPEGGERSEQHDFMLEATFSKSAATSFRISGSFVNVSFEGEKNTPVEFAMLQGLQDGKNYLWTLGLERRLAKNIQMSISYEGRKTGISNVVHVGRAQVRATF